MSTFKSKVDVQCAYCEWRGRRDKLSHHTISKHDSQRPRTRDQASLSSFLLPKIEQECSTSISGVVTNKESDNVKEPSNKLRKLESNELLSAELEFESVSSPSSEHSSKKVVEIDGATAEPSFVKQLTTINQAIFSLDKKVDEILKSNLIKPIEDNLQISEIKPAVCPETEAFEAKLKLIRVSKSIVDICNLMTCLVEEGGTIKCTPCVNNYKHIPKDIAVLKTAKCGIFSLPDEEQLIQDIQSKKFVNLKTHIIDHLKSNAHKWCTKFSDAVEKKEKVINEEHEKIGMRVTRAAYCAIKEGKGGKFFERTLSLNMLNDADIGELNHSREFFREFRQNIFFTMKANILEFLSTENPVTKHLPLVSISADKITKLHRTYQITCLITLVDGVQTCILIDISPCGTSHKGDVLVEKLENAIKTFNIKIKDQLNGMAFDGQYFDLSVDKKLAMLCDGVDYDFFLPMWDMAHRLECALNDIRKENSFSWLNSQAQTIGNIMKKYKWGIGYEELINLAEQLQVHFLNPKSFQQTRFVQSEVRVYKTFQRDFKLFFIDLQDKRTKCILKGNNTEAKNYSVELRQFSKPDFIYQVLGTIDILELVTKFSCTAQNVNICIWTVFDYYTLMKDTLKKMAMEMKSGNITEKNFPFLFKELQSLKNNVFQECLVYEDENVGLLTRSKKQEDSQDGDEMESSDKTFTPSRKRLERL